MPKTAIRHLLSGLVHRPTCEEMVLNEEENLLDGKLLVMGTSMDKYLNQSKFIRLLRRNGQKLLRHQTPK